MSHPIVPVSIACIFGRQRVPASLLAAGVVASILPDSDSIVRAMGVASRLFAHRGVTHSVFFALLAGAVGASLHRTFRARPFSVFLFLFLSTVSHGLLDAATDGGSGIAFFSPFSSHRYFFPFRPVAAAPLSVVRFFGPRFAPVMSSELRWIWLPFLSVGVVGFALRRIRALRAGASARSRGG